VEAEWLDDQGRPPKASRPLDLDMRFCAEGLVFGGGTLLASAGAGGRDITVDASDPRLVVLLSAAHLRRPTTGALRHLCRAADHWNAREDAMTGIHLALSGLQRLERPEADAQRLLLADALLRTGLEAEVLFKALDLDEREGLAKYSPDQPRVPAGSGRAGGRWTTSGGGETFPSNSRRASSSASGRGGRPVVARPVVTGAAVVVGRAGVGLDLGAMTTRASAGLAAFISGLSEVSVAAALSGLAAGAGVLLIPSTGPRGKWVHVGGPGRVSYFLNPDQPGITFRYTTADGKQRTWSGGPEGPDHEYLGPDGQVIARWVKTAGKVGLLVATAALVGSRPHEPEICPAPGKDSGPLGRAYEDFVKAQFNPGNPTPSGLSYRFLDPVTGNFRNIDDCKWQPGVVAGRPFEAGALAEYKGPGYAEHLLKKDAPWRFGIAQKLDEQALGQVRSKDSRSLTWFVEEKSPADYLSDRFDSAELPIKVIWLPWHGRPK
jgi:hypothetical protein